MFPASVKKLRPAFVGGAVGSVGASRRRWPPCRTSLRKSRKIRGFAVGVVHGGNVKGRLRVGVEKVGFQVLSLYHSILPERSLRRLGGSETPQNCWLSAESWGLLLVVKVPFLLSVSPYSPKLGSAPFYSLALPH